MNINGCLPQNHPVSPDVSPKVAGRRHHSHFRQEKGRQEQNVFAKIFASFKLAPWTCTCDSHWFVLQVLLSKNSVDTRHHKRSICSESPKGRDKKLPPSPSQTPLVILNCHSGSTKSTRKALQTWTDLCLFAPFLSTISVHLECLPEWQWQFLEETQSQRQGRWQLLAPTPRGPLSATSAVEGALPPLSCCPLKCGRWVGSPLDAQTAPCGSKSTEGFPG